MVKTSFKRFIKQSTYTAYFEEIHYIVKYKNFKIKKQ